MFSIKLKIAESFWLKCVVERTVRKSQWVIGQSVE